MNGYIWTSQPLHAKRWALVLIEDSPLDGVTPWPRVVRAPGYESSRLHDILAAKWYLSSGFVGDLTENQCRLLDQIKAETLEALGVTSLR